MTIKKFISSDYYFYFLIIYVFVTCTTVLFSVNLFGSIRSFTSRYKSMNPEINEGSIIVVKKKNTYTVGDIITYYLLENGQEEIVTHRIIQDGGNVYVTKGDANQAIDREIVRPRLIIGKVVYIIPFIGYLVNFLKGSVGMWIVFNCAMGIAALELYRIFLSLQKKR